MMITEWYTTSSSWHCNASAKVKNARAAFSMNENRGSSTLILLLLLFTTSRLVFKSSNIFFSRLTPHCPIPCVAEVLEFETSFAPGTIFLSGLKSIAALPRIWILHLSDSKPYPRKVCFISKLLLSTTSNTYHQWQMQWGLGKGKRSWIASFWSLIDIYLVYKVNQGLNKTRIQILLGRPLFSCCVSIFCTCVCLRLDRSPQSQSYLLDM